MSEAGVLSFSLHTLAPAASAECEPGDTATSTLNRGGMERSSLTRMQRPMSVAMLQCGMVGVKRTVTQLPRLSTSTLSGCTVGRGRGGQNGSERSEGPAPRMHPHDASGAAAIRAGWRRTHPHDVELLQSQRVLGVVQVPNHLWGPHGPASRFRPDLRRTAAPSRPTTPPPPPCSPQRTEHLQSVDVLRKLVVVRAIGHFPNQLRSSACVTRRPGPCSAMHRSHAPRTDLTECTVGFAFSF